MTFILNVRNNLYLLFTYPHPQIFNNIHKHYFLFIHFNFRYFLLDIILWRLSFRHFSFLSFPIHSQLHLIFFKIDLFLIKNGFRKNIRNRQFCREKNVLSYETFYTPNPQTMKEKIVKYDQHWKSRFLGLVKKWDLHHLL